MIYQPPVQPFYPNSVSQHYARRHHNSSHSLRDFLCPRHLSDSCPWRCHFKPLGGAKWLQNPAAQFCLAVHRTVFLDYQSKSGSLPRRCAGPGRNDAKRLGAVRKLVGRHFIGCGGSALG